jgi:glyoxylase-like metal-dependent hydrolase (beta-lactamase superfamily II)
MGGKSARDRHWRLSEPAVWEAVWSLGQGLMRIHDLEIHLISDAYVREDVGGTFGLVPRALYQEYIQPAEDNTILMNLMCLLVHSEGKWILVDTGLGTKLSPKAERQWQLTRRGDGLLTELQRLGVGAADIDVVVNTHLHSDHCGGNTIRGEGGLRAAFPNAEYWVQHMEWAGASHPNERTRGTYFAENFQPLMKQGRMRLLHGDTQVTNAVRLVVTPGHTRGHQSVQLQSGDWRGLFLAEVAPYAVHMMRTPWLAAFDVDPLRMLETKKRWGKWALDTGAWLFFQHDPRLFVGRLSQEGGNLRVRTVPEAAALTASLPTPAQLAGSAA